MSRTQTLHLRARAAISATLRCERAAAALLERPGIVLAAGAHDALSAKLAEEAGFDAIWASGFGISAVQAVPDANILTLTETLDAVRRICDAVDDPGRRRLRQRLRQRHQRDAHGERVRARRRRGHLHRGQRLPEALQLLRRRAARAGARPRSTRARSRRPCSARREPRLRRDRPHRGADRRPRASTRRCAARRAYADAGADAVLVHSKAAGLRRAARVRRALGPRRSPLVAVPTTYPTVGPEELHAAGLPHGDLRQPGAARRDRRHARRAAARCARPAARPASRTGSCRSRRSTGWSACPELKANEERFLFAGAEPPQRGHPRRRLRAAAPAAHPGPPEDDARREGQDHPRAPDRGARPRRRPRRRRRARLQEGAGRRRRGVALRRQRPLRRDRRAGLAVPRRARSSRAVRAPLRRHHLRAGDPGEAAAHAGRRRGRRRPRLRRRAAAPGIAAAAGPARPRRHRDAAQRPSLRRARGGSRVLRIGPEVAPDEAHGEFIGLAHVLGRRRERRCATCTPSWRRSAPRASSARASRTSSRR